MFHFIPRLTFFFSSRSFYARSFFPFHTVLVLLFNPKLRCRLRTKFRSKSVTNLHRWNAFESVRKDEKKKLFRSRLKISAPSPPPRCNQNYPIPRSPFALALFIYTSHLSRTRLLRLLRSFMCTPVLVLLFQPSGVILLDVPILPAQHNEA